MKGNVKRKQKIINIVYTSLTIAIIAMMFVGFIIADNNMHKTNFFSSDKLLNIDSSSFKLPKLSNIKSHLENSIYFAKEKINSSHK